MNIQASATNPQIKMETTPTPLPRKQSNIDVSNAAWPADHGVIHKSIDRVTSDDDILDDIVHKEKHSTTPDQNMINPQHLTVPHILGKHPIFSADKDEWADSSDDDKVGPASTTENMLSGYFHQTTPGRRETGPSFKKPKTVTRYHKLARSKEPRPKSLSTTSMSRHTYARSASGIFS